MWNRIIHKRMASDPYTDLQGCSKKGPRGFCASHSMTACCSTFSPCFPTMQLSRSGTTSQMCSRSPSTSAYVSLCRVWNSSTATLRNYLVGSTAQVPSPVQFPWTYCLPKADLVRPVQWMYPHTWQDQFNLHKKGMMPVDIQLLLMSLEAIEHICVQERSNAQSMENTSNEGVKWKQETWYQVYVQSSQESSHQESLQPLQKAWGRVYHAQHH